MIIVRCVKLWKQFATIPFPPERGKEKNEIQRDDLGSTSIQEIGLKKI